MVARNRGSTPDFARRSVLAPVLLSGRYDPILELARAESSTQGVRPMSGDMATNSQALPPLPTPSGNSPDTSTWRCHACIDPECRTLGTNSLARHCWRWLSRRAHGRISSHPLSPALASYAIPAPVQDTFDTMLHINSMPCYQPFGS